MNKFKLGKDALVIAILTLITVLTWMGVEIYWALTKTEIPQVLQRQIAPLNPKIKNFTLEKLQQRIAFTQEELGEVVLPAPEKMKLTEETATESEEPE